ISYGLTGGAILLFRWRRSQGTKLLVDARRLSRDQICVSGHLRRQSRARVPDISGQAPDGVLVPGCIRDLLLDRATPGVTRGMRGRWRRSVTPAGDTKPWRGP